MAVHDDPYIAEEVLGTGPSGKVYRGHDVAGSSLVRIKALLTRADVACVVDRDCVRAFVPHLLHLRHPQIAGVIALDEHEADFALVSETSAGDSLTACLTRRAFTAMDIRALASQLVMALQAGEALGLHHGDVKPSNVIIDDHQGAGCSLRLQDWCLADCRHEQPLETILFRAPERLNGAPASAQSDLFSTAAVIATMIFGRPPIQGETAEQCFNAWAMFDPVLLRHARPDVDPALHDWLSWLLRFDPAYRPVSAAQAQDMLAAGAMMAAYIPPMVPMYQVPVMQTWQPQVEAPVEQPKGPPVPKPRPPTTALQRTAAGATPEDGTPPAKAKRRVPWSIIFWLTSMVVALGTVGWCMSLWGSEWPDHLRRVIVEMMGGSVDGAAEAAKPAANEPVKGRYVRIEIPGKATLNLAEVEVFSNAINIATDGKASAKDSAWGGDAKLAIDGNTNGDWKKKSIYHSKDNSTTPWWEVDLGGEKIINAVKVWNRTDGNYADRLKNYSVIICDGSRKIVWRVDGQAKPVPSTRHDVVK